MFGDAQGLCCTNIRLPVSLAGQLCSGHFPSATLPNRCRDRERWWWRVVPPLICDMRVVSCCQILPASHPSSCWVSSRGEGIHANEAIPVMSPCPCGAAARRMLFSAGLNDSHIFPSVLSLSYFFLTPVLLFQLAFQDKGRFRFSTSYQTALKKMLNKKPCSHNVGELPSCGWGDEPGLAWELLPVGSPLSRFEGHPDSGRLASECAS